MKQFLAFCLLGFFLLSCQSSDQTSSEAVNPEVSALEEPFIHSVYIWFKAGVTSEQLAALYEDTEKLKTIEVVKALYTGKPASTDRPIVERSYDYAIIVHFEDLAGHDVYQEHPTHKALLEKHASLWERVMITDVER